MVYLRFLVECVSGNDCIYDYVTERNVDIRFLWFRLVLIIIAQVFGWGKVDGRVMGHRCCAG